MNRRIAWIPVTGDLLVQALSLPEGTEFIGAEMDWHTNPPYIRLLTTHPDINEVEEGGIVPTIVPQFERRIEPLDASSIFKTRMTDWRQEKRES